jgi:mycothiol synthase
MTQSDSPQLSGHDLSGLIERARAVDGQPPFSDQALVDLRTERRELLIIGAATAIASASEAEFVVEPEFRGKGHGTVMLETLIARAADGLLVWAHGDHPAARALAASHGMLATRELLQLRADIEPLEAERFEHFVPGRDESAWVELNSRAFADHPEQGSVTVVDLEQLETEAWFTAEDFLLARDGGQIVGYCWVKLEGELGEIYVIGVDPAHQGEGLGRRLLEAGIARVASRGIHTAMLYVEADNEPALALYRSLGFRTHSVDVQYRLS